MRVLLAEDDDGVAGALTEVLYEHGHLPTRVRRGEDQLACHASSLGNSTVREGAASAPCRGRGREIMS